MNDVRMAPQQAREIYRNALGLHRAGKIEQALALYGRALSLDPRLADACNNMGVALRGLGRLEVAVACYRRSLALRPEAGCYSNLGNALRELHRYDEAEAAHRQSLVLTPNRAETLFNLALVFRDRSRPAEALALIEQALGLRSDYPEAQWDRCLLWLEAGDYAAGFAAYEWRFAINRMKPRDFAQSLWDGRELAGQAILLYGEQGFGDMLQFARFAPLVAARGGKVILECAPPLRRLLTTVPGVERVVVAGEKMPAVAFQAPLLSVPRILGTTQASLPTQTPYLSPPAPRTKILTAPPGIRLKIGLVWAGKTVPKDRSCPLPLLMELFDRPDIAFYSLQMGPRAQDLRATGAGFLMADLGERLDDFADTAEILDQLDLLITVDTAIAHLAGALGKPVWVLLLHYSDWRWMLERTDSPWYPSMRLFRQERPGVWEGAVAQVKQALAELVSCS